MFFTGCSYMGETTPDGKRFDNEGVYTFSNGDTYVGAFKDGRMHGHGTLFFTKARGGGQYRGVWENGRNISGSFVFADGLVYNRNETTTTAAAPATTTTTTTVKNDGNAASMTRTGSTSTPQSTTTLGSGLMPSPPISGRIQSAGIGSTINNNGNIRRRKKNSCATGMKDSDPRSTVVDTNTTWLYCRGGDRRLWAEHLREVMPVLPLQALLAGERGEWGKIGDMTGPARWAAQPVVAPSVAAEARIPATFAEGQPRTLQDIPHEYWLDADTRARVVMAAQLPTPPFRGEETPPTVTATTTTTTTGVAGITRGSENAGAAEGTGVERTGGAVVGYGERPVMNLALRIIKPLKAEAVVAAMAAMHMTDSKSTPTTVGPQAKKEEENKKEREKVEDEEQIPSVSRDEAIEKAEYSGFNKEQLTIVMPSVLPMTSSEVGGAEDSGLVEHSTYNRVVTVHELTAPSTPSTPPTFEKKMKMAPPVESDNSTDAPNVDGAQEPKEKSSKEEDTL